MTRQIDVQAVRRAEARSPVLAVRLGRGRTGGTTGLDWLIQRARSGGRQIIVADGDRRNATLAGLYGADVMQPETDEPADVKEWIGRVLDRMVTEQTSVALDLGGGDRVLAEYGRDLDIPGFCAAVVAKPLALYFLGPEKDDLDHAWALYERGYLRSDRSVLVLNENLVRIGQTPAAAFARTMESREFRQMVAAGARPVFMPQLACLGAVRDAGMGLATAAGEGAPALGPTRSYMVRKWLSRLEEQFEGATEWLP